MRKNSKNPIKSIVLVVIIKLIDLYQKTISPDHGWTKLIFPNIGCRYYPSCSEYTKQTLMQHGVGQGLWNGLKRLGRCHPFSNGGLDPVN